VFLGIPRNSQPKPIVFRFSTANMRHTLIAVCKSILRGHKSIFAARGIAAIRRLGIACGGRAETLAGLAGTGDIVLTCTSAASRNYAFGQRLGSGAGADNPRTQGRAVVEGAASAGAIWQLARRLDVDMPIAESVVQILDEGADLRTVAAELLARPPRADGEAA